jgi:hypothetical protein
VRAALAGRLDGDAHERRLADARLALEHQQRGPVRQSGQELLDRLELVGTSDHSEDKP